MILLPHDKRTTEIIPIATCGSCVYKLFTYCWTNIQPTFVIMLLPMILLVHLIPIYVWVRRALYDKHRKIRIFSFGL